MTISTKSATRSTTVSPRGQGAKASGEANPLWWVLCGCDGAVVRRQRQHHNVKDNNNNGTNDHNNTLLREGSPVISVDKDAINDNNDKNKIDNLNENNLDNNQTPFLSSPEGDARTCLHAARRPSIGFRAEGCRRRVHMRVRDGGGLSTNHFDTICGGWYGSMLRGKRVA